MSPENSQNQNEISALKNALRGQVVHAPPSLARSHVLEKIGLSHPARPALRWVFGALLGLVIFVFLWGIVQPGIVLKWVWQPGDVENFQVYRAPQDSDQFTFLSEIPTREASTEYTFVDPLLIPGKTYTYHIVGFDAEGKSIFSQMIRDSSLAALPGQIALVVASLVIALGLLPGLERINFNNLMKSKMIV